MNTQIKSGADILPGNGGTTGQEKYRCMDVGMDSTGEIVISMERAIGMIKDNEIKKHHH